MRELGRSTYERLHVTVIKGTDLGATLSGFKSPSVHLVTGSFSMFPNLSRPQFSHLSCEDNDSIYLIRLLWRLHELIYRKLYVQDQTPRQCCICVY